MGQLKKLQSLFVNFTLHLKVGQHLCALFLSSEVFKPCSCMIIEAAGRLKIFFGFSANVEAQNGLHHIISNSQHFYAISTFLSNF